MHGALSVPVLQPHPRGGVPAAARVEAMTTLPVRMSTAITDQVLRAYEHRDRWTNRMILGDSLQVMASLAELARFFTRLEPAAVNQLQRLSAGWGLLADFCFADLLLFGVVGESRESGGNRFVVLAQVRPTTAQTVYRSDWVGTVLEEEERPLVARAYRLGEIIEGEMSNSPLKERVRVLCIPVRYEGKVIGVLTRESAPSFGRQPGEPGARFVAHGDFETPKLSFAISAVRLLREASSKSSL